MGCDTVQFCREITFCRVTLPSVWFLELFSQNKQVRKFPAKRNTSVSFAFKARLQNCEKRLLASICMSFRLHGTTRLLLDGFL
jgi:hypothetical protein